MQNKSMQTEPLTRRAARSSVEDRQGRTEQETAEPDILRSTIVFSVLLAALAATGLYNYLLFHTIAELVAVAIATGVFIVAWNARTMRENGYLLAAGTGLLFVAGIELVHTLAYDGMGIFVGYGANLPTQLWIASRYLLAGTLLAAPLVLRRNPGPRWVVTAFAGTSALLLLSPQMNYYTVAIAVTNPQLSSMIASPYDTVVEETTGLAGALGKVWMNIAALIVFPSAFFAATYVKFMRMDIR